MWSGISRLAEYRAAGDLTGLKAVIIDLGTNGPMTPEDVAQLRALTAGVPLLVLVNVRVPLPWQGESNASLAAAQGPAQGCGRRLVPGVGRARPTLARRHPP